MVKRVLIFSLSYYPDGVSGAEVAIKEITDRLPGSVVFDMITLGKIEPKFEKVGNINVYRVGPLFFNRQKHLGRLSKYIFIFSGLLKAVILNRKNKYETVWSMMANYAGFSALFFKILNPKVQFVLTLQEGDPFEYIKRRVGILFPLFKMIFKKADKITALSKYLADWSKEMGFTKEVAIVPNGVDINIFKALDANHELEEKEKIRKELGIKNDEVLLITTSRLVVKNGIGDVIRALLNLDQKIIFLILGIGELEKSLKQLTKDSKLKERVIFKGFVSHRDMPKFLRASDIFIRASLSEGFGNSFIEAMACKIPVIATPVGGIPDFLIDFISQDFNRSNQTGYFCKPNDPESIVKAIQRVVDDPNKNQVIENAYKMVAEKYDWNLISRQMGGIFDSM